MATIFHVIIDLHVEEVVEFQLGKKLRTMKSAEHKIVVDWDRRKGRCLRKGGKMRNS